MKKNKIKKFKNGDTVKVYIYIDDVNTASLKVIGIINAHNFVFKVFLILQLLLLVLLFLFSKLLSFC